MRRGKLTKSSGRQRGYMMITLMLAVALMAVALLAVLPAIRLQVQRDRELELQHRGTAYMRAIQHFYKKFNRYPMRVEELENTNNFRFLRKRYKDPINRDPATGKEREFKLLHQQDISLNNGPVLGQTPGQVLPGMQSGSGLQGRFGSAGQGMSGMAGALGGLGTPPGGIQAAGSTTTPPEGGDSGDAAEKDGNANSTGAATGSSSGSPSSSGFNGPTFGGGPILGVASTSKEKSVRVFFEKNHYKDWLFIYVPQADSGGLLTGPINPGMPAGNLNGMVPGQGLGSGAGLGQGQGVGLNPAAQNPPPTSPQNPVQNPPEQ